MTTLYQWLTKVPWFDYHIDEQWRFYNAKLRIIWGHDPENRKWWWIVLRKDWQTHVLSKARLVYATYYWLDYYAKDRRVMMKKENDYSIPNLIKIWKH